MLQCHLWHYNNLPNVSWFKGTVSLHETLKPRLRRHDEERTSPSPRLRERERDSEQRRSGATERSDRQITVSTVSTRSICCNIVSVLLPKTGRFPPRGRTCYRNGPACAVCIDIMCYDVAKENGDRFWEARQRVCGRTGQIPRIWRSDRETI